jgi:hypothetical protein
MHNGLQVQALPQRMLGRNTKIVNVCIDSSRISGVAVLQRSFGSFFEHFEAFSEHGIFHGIINWQENKSLKIKYKNGLFTIEWE